MIRWDLPIETITGLPAKVVYTGVGDRNRCIIICPGEIDNEYLLWTDDNGYTTSKQIRNVPEPPIKLEGWIGIDVRDGSTYASGVFDTYDRVVPRSCKYILNLALVAEKCPEAIERVG